MATQYIMKIAFLSHRVPFPPNKGEKIRTFHQIEYLARQGHQLHVLCPVNGHEDIGYLDALGKRYCNSTAHAPNPGRISYLHALLSGRAISVVNFYSSSLQQQLDNLLATQQIDAVVCTASSMAEYVFRSSVLNQPAGTRPTLVMDFMDLDSDKWRQYEKLKGFPLSLVYRREARLIARFERRIHDVFDAAMFISQAEVDLFLQSNPDLGKLHVIGNGLDTKTFRPATTPKSANGPIMLFTGVMDYLPNEDAVAWFVEGIWNQVRARHPDAMFYIAGMNPSARVQALQKYPGIVVTGFVDDIMEYFDKAHLFVAPFRIARGVQNKVLQAFACGLPTITTPMGCEGIQCQDGKHVLVASTLEQTLQKIDWVVSHPAEARRIGTHAAELVQRDFSWDGKLAALESILSARS